MSSEKNAFVASLQLLGKIQKKSNFIFIFGQMIEDQVLFHLSKFGGKKIVLKEFSPPIEVTRRSCTSGSRIWVTQIRLDSRGHCEVIAPIGFYSLSAPGYALVKHFNLGVYKEAPGHYAYPPPAAGTRVPGYHPFSHLNWPDTRNFFAVQVLVLVFRGFFFLNPSIRTWI